MIVNAASIRCIAAFMEMSLRMRERPATAHRSPLGLVLCTSFAPDWRFPSHSQLLEVLLHQRCSLVLSEDFHARIYTESRESCLHRRLTTRSFR